jgi:hypothetical protein
MHTDVKPAELRLVNGTDTIIVRPRQAGAFDPIMCKSWDLGAPEVRYTTVANPGADGVTESDGFLGSRTVQLELQIMGGYDPVTKQVHDAYWYAQKLTQMAHPRSKPVLEVSREEDVTWRLSLRGDPFSMPFTSRSAALIDLTLTFVCPSGFIESELLPFTTGPSGDGATVDLDFAMVFPFTFGPAGDAYPQLNLNVGGDSPVTPGVFISGPVTDPEVRSGPDRFRFDGLTLAAGETVYIDMGSGAVRLITSNGEVSEDMGPYNTVDWAVSSFWVWEPGPHNVRFYSTTGTVTVQYRERRLTI